MDCGPRIIYSWLLSNCAKHVVVLAWWYSSLKEEKISQKNPSPGTLHLRESCSSTYAMWYECMQYSLFYFYRNPERTHVKMGRPAKKWLSSPYHDIMCIVCVLCVCHTIPNTSPYIVHILLHALIVMIDNRIGILALSAQRAKIQ